jgi:hypothetical protein
MSPEREIRLECAAFLDSARAARLAVERADLRAIVERFLSCAYEELGKAPHLLEGDDLEQILRERLPAHFGKKDPLAERVEDVLAAFLAHLGERAVVLHAFELTRALAEHAPAFRAQVASGELAGRAPQKRERPFVHGAEKTGRNDPCPCGSGKKFKQCCMRLG